MKYVSKSEKETEKIATNLAQKLKGGEIIALMGNLGAGKTVFVRGLVKIFKIKKPITSPTFVLMKTYRIMNHELRIKNFVHVDAYRLENSNDLEYIGILDYLGKSDTIVVIEWADRVKRILPKDVIKIKIKLGKDKNERILDIDNF